MFRLLITALAAAFILSFAPSAHAQEPPPLLGDVSCDGDVTSIDAALILQFDSGLIGPGRLPCPDGGDVNADGRIDPVDAALVLQYVAGLIDELPPSPPDPLPSPASGGIAIGSAEVAQGQEFTVPLEARGITTPGLGAWSIDVAYDPAAVSLVDCSNPFRRVIAVCNGEYATGVLRLSGASAGGLEGDTELALLTFQCGAAEGVSDLTLTPRVFADATIGGPQPFVPTVTNGSIACAKAPLPTPRPGAGRLNITLIHDLNADGVFDPGEPGLEGWSVAVAPACSDALLGLDPTNTEGRTTAETFSEKNCVIVQRVGWVLTSGSRSVNVEPGATVEATFLFRKVGQQFLRLTGDLLVDGLPATDSVALDAVVGGRSCGDAQIAVGTRGTFYSLYILGNADRAECAAEGQSVDITVNGTAVHDLTFISNRLDSDNVDLILGPTPMWFVEIGTDGVAPVPFVGSVMCGEARGGSVDFITSDIYTIYVFPDALRSGCGAPGRIITLRVGDEVLRHVLWQEGFVGGGQLQDVELPRVGTFAQTSESGFSLRALTYAITLSMSGLSLLFVGAVIRRRRQAG